MEDKLRELPSVTSETKKNIYGVFDRAMENMSRELYALNKDIASALEEGCSEARWIAENLKEEKE